MQRGISHETMWGPCLSWHDYMLPVFASGTKASDLIRFLIFFDVWSQEISMLGTCLTHTPPWPWYDEMFSMFDSVELRPQNKWLRGGKTHEILLHIYISNKHGMIQFFYVGNGTEASD